MQRLITTIAVFSLGASLHFLHLIPHDKKKHNLLDVISAINESTWEHMKIFINGVLIYTLIFILLSSQESGGFLLASGISALVSVLFLPLIYYGYKWLLGKNFLILDISIFFIISWIYAGTLPKLEIFFRLRHYEDLTLIGIILWLLIILIEGLWTYDPPKFFLFKCPVDNKFGHPRIPLKKNEGVS